MARAVKVFEFGPASRNLFTNPIDITGLEGDTYDYELVTFFEAEGLSSALVLTLNNDVGSNYRNYSMTGDGSSASAFVTDVGTSGNIGGNSFTYSALGIHSLSGESSNERVLSSLYSISSSSGDTRVIKRSVYWKNTLDEITSIQLSKAVSVTSNFHIILYATLKESSQENWEKINTLSWNSETATKSFTVDGNEDGQYRLVWDLDVADLNTEINNDGGANYTRQYLRNASGTISAANAVNTSISPVARQGSFILNAKTGTKRLIISSGSRNAQSQNERTFWYSDTTTNITTLDCTPSASATGTATLYRKKPTRSGTLPWRLVQSVPVSGDFSAGHTFSGLEGDSTKLYRLEWLGDISGAPRFRINNDSGNNYDFQQLFAQNSGVSAASSPGNDNFNPGGANLTSYNIYIYPKSGSSRPMISESVYNENTILLRAHWYTESISEITSIFAYNSTTNVNTGTLNLYELK